MLRCYSFVTPPKHTSYRFTANVLKHCFPEVLNHLRFSINCLLFYLISDETVNMVTLNQNNTTDDELCFNNENYLANQSLHNLSEETYSDGSGESLTYWINSLMIFELPVTICFISVALHIMLRCRKLSFCIRYISVNVLIAFLSIAIINITFTALRLILGPTSCYYRLIFDSRTFIGTMLLSVLWCSMCVLTIERFIAIVFPYRYVQYVTKSTVYITVSLTWAINIIIPIVIVFISWLNVCGHYDYISKCDILKVYRPFRIFIAVILCISFATTIASYTKIFLKARQHEREIRALDVKSTFTTDKNKSTGYAASPRPTILFIVLSFIVLQSPYLINIIIFELRPDWKLQKWRVLLQITCYLCHELDTFVTLYLYIWKFPECKMHFYHMFSKINGKYSAKAEALRIDVFNIVTFERNNHTSL